MKTILAVSFFWLRPPVEKNGPKKNCSKRPPKYEKRFFDPRKCEGFSHGMEWPQGGRELSACPHLSTTNGACGIIFCCLWTDIYEVSKKQKMLPMYSRNRCRIEPPTSADRDRDLQIQTCVDTICCCKIRFPSCSLCAITHSDGKCTVVSLL